VLASRNRLRRTADFSRVVSDGNRGSSATLVVYCLPDSAERGPLAGFIVGRSVGGAVVRKRVTRRLRALVSERIGALPASHMIVVRALPAAASAPYAELARDLDQAFTRQASRSARPARCASCHRGHRAQGVGVAGGGGVPMTGGSAFRRGLALAVSAPFIAAILVYQRVISPWTPPSCRFYPSCSEYALRAIRTHGVLRGGWLAVRRIGRCHPWTAGGVDHVPPVRTTSAPTSLTGA
jgi:uncharacterized protein